MTEDAQRDLEQRALRNVRGLVDRMDAEEALSRRHQLKLMGALLVAIAVMIVGALLIVGRPVSTSGPVDLKSIKAPQARPQGSRTP